MNRHLTSWMVAIGSLAAAPALAQIQPMGVPAPRPAAAPAPRTTAPTPPAPGQGKRTPAKSGPDVLAPTNPDFKADQPSAQVAPTPAPLPPAVWDVINAADLLRYIGRVDKEGLNPADYDPLGLQAAIQSGNIAAFSAAATDRFNRLSSDLALGHVKKPGRIDWWVADNDLNAEKQDALLRSALAAHGIEAALDGLLPTGEGLVTFTDLDEAAAGVEAIARDWQRHANAARELAEAHLDSDVVLGRLLDVVGTAGSVAA